MFYLCIIHMQPSAVWWIGVWSNPNPIGRQEYGSIYGGLVDKAYVAKILCAEAQGGYLSASFKHLTYDRFSYVLWQTTDEDGPAAGRPVPSCRGWCIRIGRKQCARLAVDYLFSRTHQHAWVCLHHVQVGCNHGRHHAKVVHWHHVWVNNHVHSDHRVAHVHHSAPHAGCWATLYWHHLVRGWYIRITRVIFTSSETPYLVQVLT